MNTTRVLALSLALAFLALVFLAVSAPTAHAADPVIVRVKVHGATDGACGNTWATACNLQYALTSTVALPGTELWVAAGVYTPTTGTDRTATFQLRDNIALYGGFAMTETLRTQRNFTAHVTILSGDIGTPGDDSDNSYQVVTGSGAMWTAVLDGFTVTGGKADGLSYPYSYGGGMYNSRGSPTLTNIAFISNTSSYMGGGMYNGGSYPMLTNVTFSSNSAPMGGGMYNGGSNPTLTNVTFSGNSAVDGGGMYNEYLSSPMLTNVTFSGNSTVSYGCCGGMSNYSSSPTIRNTIFWGNTGSQISNSSSAPTISDSVVEGGCPAGSACTNIIAADPLLGAVGNYGGSTQTIPLLPGSSAINAGNDAICAPTDQRGKPRLGVCDIGAFEFQGYKLTKTGGDQQSTRVNTSFGSSLQVQLNEIDTGLLPPGVVLTFTAPSSGASAAWSGSLVVTATTNASGLATVSPPTANGIAGSYAVTATTPDANPPATFALTNVKSDTTTTISSSADPSVVGRSIAFTAVVSGASASGSVAFKDGGAILAGCGSVALSGGTAQCTTSALAVGSHAITAVYSGDANDNASTSAVYTQTVSLVNDYLPLIRK